MNEAFYDAGKEIKVKVSSVNEMRQMDHDAITRYGIAAELLMENAGKAAFTLLNQKMPVAGKTFVIVCGGGNNGGDGFVVARHIISRGGRPVVFLLAGAEKYQGAAKVNLDIISKLPLETGPLKGISGFEEALRRCDGVVDAIFGTGLVREVKGRYAEVITAINASGKPVLSLDIPSGVNGDNGRVMGAAVQADWTVTFGLVKYGNLLYPGAQKGGDLTVTHISFPPELYDSPGVKVGINLPGPLPERNPAGHKGTFGNALFVAGAPIYFGAPYLAAVSFLKSGGGYSRLACPASMVPHLAQKAGEVVMAPMAETDTGTIALSNVDQLLALSRQMDWVVVGPGLSLDSETAELVVQLTSKVDVPLLIDGDGLTAVANHLDVLRQRKTPTILTPHPGEMSRLAHLSPDEIRQNPITVLQEFCSDLQSIVVLKGAHSLIGLPDGSVFINLTGNSGMGSAGAGDVLAGTIAAMGGLGLEVASAVRCGVLVHGLAGDLAAEAIGEDGMTAGDMLRYLPSVLKKYRDEKVSQWFQTRYGPGRC